jgi:hypothetical protein
MEKEPNLLVGKFFDAVLIPANSGDESPGQKLPAEEPATHPKTRRGVAATLHLQSARAGGKHAMSTPLKGKRSVGAAAGKVRSQETLYACHTPTLC